MLIDILTTAKISKDIQKIKPDVICIPNPNYLVFLIKLFNKNTLLCSVIHDPEPHLGEKTIVNKMVIKMMILCSDVLVTHGKKLKNMLLEQKIKRPVFVVPHGTFDNFGNIKEECEHKQKHDENKHKELYNLLFFGRIVKYKGLDVLLKAVPLITKEFKNIRLILAGKGNLEEYENLIKMYEQYLLIRNEFIPDKEVPQIFKMSDIVVLPYKEGTQSGVLAIAYALKRPVVASAVGAIPEAVENGKSGMLIPPNNEEALAGAILYLLKNPKERKKLAILGHRRGKKCLSWERTGKRLLCALVSIES